MKPTRKASSGWAVVACMDTRLDLTRIVGPAAPGEVDILRNAGGVATTDVIRSLSISQLLHGTVGVAIVQHPDCLLSTITDSGFAAQVTSFARQSPPWRAGAFTSVTDAVAHSMSWVRASPFLPRVDRVRGVAYDVASGRITEVLVADGKIRLEPNPELPLRRTSAAGPAVAPTVGQQPWSGWWTT